MASDLSALGDLVIQVGGDIGPFETALNEIPAAAQKASQELDAMFAGVAGGGLDQVETKLAGIGEQLNLFESYTAPAAEQMKLFGESIDSIHVGPIEQLRLPLEDLKPPLDQDTESVQSLGSAITDLAAAYLTFQGLKAAVIDSVEAFGQLERAGEALTALVGDADQASAAIEGLRALAQDDALSFPSLLTAQQRLVAVGVPLENMQGILDAIANGARGMNETFDAVASKIERMSESGVIANRTLASMGLNLENIGEAMDMAGASAKDIQTAFKGLADEGERATVLAAALDEKFGGLAQQTANDVTGSWDRVKNAVNQAFQQIGASVDGFKVLGTVAVDAIKGIETALFALELPIMAVERIVIALVETLVDAFKGLAKGAYDAMHGDFTAAWNDVANIGANVETRWKDAWQAVVADTTDTGKRIAQVWTDSSATVNRALGEIPKGVAGLDELAKEVARFSKTVATDLARIPDTYEEYLAKLEDGGKKASASLSKISSDIDQAQQLMAKGASATAVHLDELLAKQKELKDFAEQDTLGKIALQVQDFVNKYADQIGMLDEQSQIWIQAMLKIAAAQKTTFTDAEMLKELEKVAAGLKTVGDETNKTDAAMQAWHDKAIPRIGKMKESTDDLGASLSTVRLEFEEMTTNLEKLGIRSQQVLADNIAYLQRTLELAQQFVQPLSVQLELESRILTAQIQFNAAIGASAESTLKLTEQLEAVKVKQGAIYDQTMALSNLYTGLVKVFSDAWKSVSTGIADAVVSGQNFGQVFTNIFDTLKKQVAELVTQYLMTQLKDAILQNTNLLQDFGKVFNSIFAGASGGTAPVIDVLKQAQTNAEGAAKAIENTFATGAQQIEQSTKAATSGITSVASSAMSTITSVISMATGIISAITGIIETFQLSHMNKLLGEIEVTSRQIANIVGLNGAESIFGYTKAGAQAAQSIRDVIWNQVVTLLTQINSDLDDADTHLVEIMGDIHSIAQGGISGAGGSGGGGTSLGDLLVAFNKLMGHVNNLDAIMKNANDSVTTFGAVSTTAADQIATFAEVASTVTSTVATTAQTLAAVNSAVAQAVAPIVSGTAGGPSPFSSFTPNIPAAPAPAGIGASGSTTLLGGSNAWQAGYAPTVSGIAPGGGVHVTVNLQAGVVAGSGGMRQLSEMVGEQIVTKLRQVAGLKV